MKSILLFIMLFPLISISQDTAKTYHADGQVHILSLKKGADHLYEKIFYESGKLASEGEVIISAKEMIWGKAYYEDGGKKLLVTDSFEILYDNDSALVSITPRKNYKKHGIRSIFVEKRLLSETEYKYGMKNGSQVIYDTVCNKFFEEQYVNGKKDGKSIGFDREGKVEKIIYYSSGCPTKLELYSAGRLSETILNKESLWLAVGKPKDCN
jgi:antitoxin component YwqK of YwqJK toxin-antitoxin module